MSATIARENSAPYGSPPERAEQRVLLRGASWKTYLALLNDLGQKRNCRLAYSDGVLEIMAPYFEHENCNEHFKLLINALARDYGFNYISAGALTCKRQDLEKGLEPDSCFYFQNAAHIRGKKNLDLSIDPPPDLMIEIDITRSSMNKIPICAMLGVQEHWRYDGTALEIRLLKNGQYETSEESGVFPGLPLRTEVPRFLSMGFDDGLIAMQDAFTDWLRAQRKDRA
jgi:Uma2 family endonuclease